jgi:outer membrane protease
VNAAEAHLWRNHQARWELEMIGQPGVFGDLCQMDALDWMGPEKFKDWMTR